MTEHLVVHTRRGVVEVPLTGDPRVDAFLERFCLRGGAVLRDGKPIQPTLQTSAVARGDAWEPAE
jgi:hypothetical protein